MKREFTYTMEKPTYILYVVDIITIVWSSYPVLRLVIYSMYLHADSMCFPGREAK